MKKILFIIFLFCSFVARSQNQDTPPTGSNFKTIATHSISYFVTDSSVWMFKGAYGWNKLVTNRGLKFKIDSIMGLNNGSYKLKNDSTNTRSGYTTLYRNGLKLNISDTALMLAHYAKQSGLLLKLNISDTALMLNSYAKNIALALRLKLSDTASMLAPYAKNITVNGKKDKNDSIVGSGYYTNYKALSKLNTSDRGALNGVASLVNGTVPLSQMNAALIGAVKYQGVYNASTNTPNIPNADTTKGWYYIVNTAGTQGGLTYGVGDWIISNGVQWGRVKTTAYSIMYEISVTTSGVTTFMIPFPLTDISNVFYNGNSISSDIWSGVGTTSITLNADTRVYDKIKIQN